MDQYFFRTAFAQSGTVAAIPVPLQPGGEVSFTEGFTADYSIPLAPPNPARKNVPRDQTNQLYFAITQAIQQYQTFGAPEWITNADNGGVAYSYSAGATVRYWNGATWAVYVSLIDTNTTVPGTNPLHWQIRSNVATIPFVIAGGTSNVLTAAFSPAVSVATQVIGYIVQAASNNTGATTFNPNGIGALPLVAYNGDTLWAGAIAGTGHELLITYNVALASYMLMNPKPQAPGVSLFEQTAATAYSGGGQNITFTHTLGIQPKAMQLVAKCTAALGDAGYALGDMIFMASNADSNLAGGNSLMIRAASATTNIYYEGASSGLCVVNSTGTTVYLTAAKWELYVLVQA